MGIEEAEIQRNVHREQLCKHFVRILNPQRTNGNLFEGILEFFVEYQLCIIANALPTLSKKSANWMRFYVDDFSLKYEISALIWSFPPKTQKIPQSNEKFTSNRPI